MYEPTMTFIEATWVREFIKIASSQQIKIHRYNNKLETLVTNTFVR